MPAASALPFSSDQNEDSRSSAVSSSKGMSAAALPGNTSSEATAAALTGRAGFAFGAAARGCDLVADD